MRGNNALIINYKDIQGGGASFAGYAVFQSLRAYSGYEPYMLCGKKLSEEPHIAEIPVFENSSVIGKYVLKVRRRISNHFLGTEYWSPQALQLFGHEFYKNSDIVNLHNLHGANYFSDLALDKLGSEKPVVITMQDMWYLTGHCAYSYDCLGYLSGCNTCPHLNYYPAVKYDVAGFLFRKKFGMYRKHGFTFVSCSKWFAEIARKCFEREGLSNEVVHINNAIETDRFLPVEAKQKAILRTQYNIPADAKVICFGVAFLNDPRKGLQALLEKIDQEFAQDQKLFLLLMGNADDFDFGRIPSHLPYLAMGSQVTPAGRNTGYGLSDLLILPTLADDLPNVILESMCAGVPVVCFDTGGCGEAVITGQTGYLARYMDYADFLKGIETILKLPEAEYAVLSGSARNMILDHFSEKYCAAEYGKLFDSILKKKEKSA
ncbi:MAG TPA: glycosyltransferase [Bacteroidia bacterium]|jgi:glycosyltransferase involved in cell wall biosynthesis|nr:glycosyltransferase [Bacteroidia bacterium]